MGQDAGGFSARNDGTLCSFIFLVCPFSCLHCLGSGAGLRGRLDLDDLGLLHLHLGLDVLDLCLEAGAGQYSQQCIFHTRYHFCCSHLLADKLQAALDGALGVAPVCLEQYGADQFVDGLAVLELGELLIFLGQHFIELASKDITDRLDTEIFLLLCLEFLPRLHGISEICKVSQAQSTSPGFVDIMDLFAASCTPPTGPEAVAGYRPFFDGLMSEGGREAKRSEEMENNRQVRISRYQHTAQSGTTVRTSPL